MRLSPLLPLLPAVAVAQDQFPLFDRLKTWFSNAVPSAVPSVIPNIPNPLDAGAAKVASVAVHSGLNTTNFKSTLLAPAKQPATSKSPREEEWLVFVTGGNKTCYGVCGTPEKAWNTSVAILASAPNAPHLGSIDCEGSGALLCSQLNVNPPSIYHILIPRPYLVSPTSGATPPVTIRYIHLNHTAVTPAEIAEIHSKQTYKAKEPYTGLFHPFDGLLAKYGLDLPVAYAFWAFAKMPSWMPMILISFISRSFMGRKVPQARQQPAPAAAAPAS